MRRSRSKRSRWRRRCCRRSFPPGCPRRDQTDRTVLNEPRQPRRRFRLLLMKCHEVNAGLKREGKKRQESERGHDIDDSLRHRHPPHSRSVLSCNDVRRSPCSDFKKFVVSIEAAVWNRHVRSRWSVGVRGINRADAP